MEARVAAYVNKSYKYGFNNMEEHDMIKGASNFVDFGSRNYCSRLGRFLSVDFVTILFSDLSPYQFASNTPIQAIDLDGHEGYKVTDHTNKSTTIVVDLVYYTSGKGRMSRKQAVRARKSMFTQFIKPGPLYDLENTDKDGNYYQVNLVINLVEAPVRRKALKWVQLNKQQYGSSASYILLTKIFEQYNPESGGWVAGQARRGGGYLDISKFGDGHTNLHELWHLLVHNHPNAPEDLKNQIPYEGDQEQGHYDAGGIFVYANENLGRSEQNLSQKNVTDALGNLDDIPKKRGFELEDLPVLVGQEKQSDD